MSPDNENMLIRSTKPPPPVPPRPSKTLVKEALAKTRKAQVTSTTTIRNDVSATKEPNRSNQSNDKPIQTKISNSIKTSSIFLRCEQIQENSRPVIYQSSNCKSRPTVPAPQTPQESKPTIPRNHVEPLLRRLEINNKADTKTTSQKKLQEDTDKILSPVNSKNYSLKKNDDDEESKITAKESDLQTTIEEDSASVFSSSLCNEPKVDDMSDKAWEEALKDKNHVNTLIDEMFASVLEVNLAPSISPTSSLESFKESDNVIKISNHFYPSESDCRSNSDSETFKSINDDTDVKKPINEERKVKFNDRENHEFLIEELQNMKSNNNIGSRRVSESDSHNGDKIQINDWYGVSDGKKVRMSSCHIKVDDTESENSDRSEKIRELSQAYRLPPLPKALSGFNINEPSKFTTERHITLKDPKPLTSGREETNLDRQLAILRREMACLREQDMFLLSKLWFLSEAIQDFRQMLQSQEEEKMTGYEMPPSPTPSSIEDEDYNYLISTSTC